MREEADLDASKIVAAVPEVHHELHQLGGQGIQAFTRGSPLPMATATGGQQLVQLPDILFPQLG